MAASQPLPHTGKGIAHCVHRGGLCECDQLPRASGSADKAEAGKEHLVHHWGCASSAVTAAAAAGCCIRQQQSGQESCANGIGILHCQSAGIAPAAAGGGGGQRQGELHSLRVLLLRDKLHAQRWRGGAGLRARAGGGPAASVGASGRGCGCGRGAGRHTAGGTALRAACACTTTQP